VAHEVKNPLATLLIGIDHLADHYPAADEALMVLLQDMNRAVQRADAVIKGLLDFAAGETLRLSLEDLNAILTQTLQLLKHELDRSHVTVIKELDPALPRLALDRGKIEQALLNLCMNAIQAMPTGGTLTIRTSGSELTDEVSARGRRRTDPFQLGESVAVVELLDTGAGIPEAALPKVFDPFFTTKATGQGTGLGLTVTRKIIELHGGTIDVQNRPGGGVQVTIIVPVKGGLTDGETAHPARG
jgi:signal transduction histidine kinase